jgi:hypothetical protein
MSPEEFKLAMQALIVEEQNDGDTEETHYKADELMCDILEELGYGDGVALFNKLNKWYA